MRPTAVTKVIGSCSAGGARRAAPAPRESPPPARPGPPLRRHRRPRERDGPEPRWRRRRPGRRDPGPATGKASAQLSARRAPEQTPPLPKPGKRPWKLHKKLSGGRRGKRDALSPAPRSSRDHAGGKKQPKASRTRRQKSATTHPTPLVTGANGTAQAWDLLLPLGGQRRPGPRRGRAADVRQAVPLRHDPVPSDPGGPAWA